MNRIISSRIKRWFNVVSTFLIGQGSVQAINLVTGFFLLRWMSVEDFAQYSVAFGFQSTVGILVDVGFTGSIITLVGDRGADKAVVGSYICSARYFRNRMLALLIPLSAVGFFLLTARQHWSLLTSVLLFISIVISIFFNGERGFYLGPLLIHQKLNQVYSTQIVSSVVRLGISYLFNLMSLLSAWVNAWVSAFSIFLNCWSYRRDSKGIYIEPVKADPKVTRQMVKYISPLIPGIIFYAFQGQITIFLISIFGQTQNIAEIAALGRLGQLFAILTTFNSVVISPYIARVAKQKIAKRYFQVMGIAIIISAFICLFGFMFPKAILWILGSKYQRLGFEASLIIVASCINYINSVVWTINKSRQWIYLWHTSLMVSLTILVQVFCMINMKLDSTINMIIFSIITSVVSLLVSLIGSGYGFYKGTMNE
ncbi:lipopolysaccharide biosynthesis protein [Nostoc sp. CALU 1950]|uniref:lipopolysaccharide biosynthesis protein n=1 Tax=Nostoc sp. CALU 1950 TaxID=3104321 RepID=UPI003EC07305